MEDKKVICDCGGFLDLQLDIEFKINLIGTKKLGVLRYKNFLFSTGSFKDRGTAFLISKIKELKIKRVVEDSSGNSGTSIG